MSSASSTSTRWEPGGELEREAYYALLGQLAALGTAVEQLELDPAVLQLSLGAPAPVAGPEP